MIAWLRGRVVQKGIDGVVLDVGGVGYHLLISLRTLEALPELGSETVLHVHTHVREDALLLFGFSTADDRRVFLDLTNVTGVGPKLALNALSMYATSELVQAIVDGDIKRLARISGVGPKMAQRLVLELKERLQRSGVQGGPSLPAAAGSLIDDVRVALVDLGFSKKEADRVSDELLPRARDGATIEELLKAALALLRS